jgi:hypothetical protein
MSAAHQSRAKYTPTQPDALGSHLARATNTYSSFMTSTATTFAEPMKSRTGAERLAAYKRVHTLLSRRGLKPQLQKLDNEASKELLQFMTTEAIDYQLVPPSMHRQNAAERAIQTFKNHFISTLCGNDKDFPMHLWDRLLPQALLTLNLLCSSHINPRLDACTGPWGLRLQSYSSGSCRHQSLGP